MPLQEKKMVEKQGSGFPPMYYSQQGPGTNAMAALIEAKTAETRVRRSHLPIG
jgi:hypothetical protein